MGPIKLIVVAALVLLAGCESRTAIEEAWVVSPVEATRWAQLKSDNLPAMTGSPEWQRYLGFLETELRQAGAVDVYRNSWEFERWDTSDEPTDWSLVSDGKPIRVANYGANSGSTGPEGITAELVYYDHAAPPESIAGKIVVIPTRPHPVPPYSEAYLVNYTYLDYEFSTDPESYPEPFTPVNPAASFTFDIWYQLYQELHDIAIEGGAVGAVVVYDMAWERTRGIYSFPVPEHYSVPTLQLSREDGAQVIANARAGKQATLRLEASVATAQAYQLIAYLPGKNYGTEADEQIVLVNHTDGPSITQDNGALGLLAIVQYFANIPQHQRDRTLVVYLDCRHYMPGMESAYIDESWLSRQPEKADKFVGLIHIEHMGEMDYRERDGVVEPTGMAEQSYLWTRNNPLLIDAAIAAVQKYGWSRAQVVAPERNGIRGGPQQPWWGVGVLGQRDSGYNNCEVWRCLDLPGFGLGGFLGNYWSSAATIDRWNLDLFLGQAKTMIELTDVLMKADLQDIEPEAKITSYMQVDSQ